jgi:hypothetical protein
MYSCGFVEVMKRLLRSTGTCPAAKRISAGIVVVNPTRRASLP